MVSSIQTALLCPHCQTVITPDSEVVHCDVCQSSYHRQCWQQHGGCANAGCAHPVSTTQHNASSVPTPTAPEQPTIAIAPARHVSHVLVGAGLLALLVLFAVIARSAGMSMNTILLIEVVFAALSFDFVNGMNDSGNAIATVISTRVLTPLAALCMAAILNFVGAVVMEGVAESIASKIALNFHLVTPLMILCGLIGAICWAYAMARIGLPISMSHALIGGLVGVFLVTGIRLHTAYVMKICVWMLLAPILGFVLGWSLMLLIMWVFRDVAPHKMYRNFRVWQVFSSGLMAFSHGANDAQKAMGIITLALVASGFMQVAPGQNPHIPLWVKIVCALTIALGTGLGGRKVIGTLGHKIFKLTSVHGFAAEAVAALTIQFATMMRVPISTTHVISSSILGVGSSKRLSAVRWGVAGNIVSAWIFTIPTCGIVGALLYLLVSFLTKLH